MSDQLDLKEILNEEIYKTKPSVSLLEDNEKEFLQEHVFIKELAGIDYYICDCGAALIGHNSQGWSLVLPAHNDGFAGHLKGNYAEIKNILL